MHDIELWEAVGRWFSGEKLEGFAMYGLPLLWWTRIGKLLQFIGGLIIVVELVGPDKFKRAQSVVESIRAPYSAFVRDFFADHAVSNAEFLDLSIREHYWWEGADEAALKGFAPRPPRLLLKKLENNSIFVSLACSAAVAFMVYEIYINRHLSQYLENSESQGEVLNTLASVAVSSVFSGGALLLFLSLVGCVEHVFRSLVTLANAGSRPSHPLRWAAFIFATIGFLLDLLGS